MGFKQLPLLAILFFASSTHLPINATQIENNLIEATIVKLHQTLKHKNHENLSLKPICQTHANADSSTSTHIPGNSTSSHTEPPVRVAQKTNLLRLSTLDHQQNDILTSENLLKSKRISKPIGSWLIRIDAAAETIGSHTNGETARSTPVKTEKTTKYQSNSAVRKLTHRPSGSYIFLIREIGTHAESETLIIDPRILPNYQLTDDPYWQYYDDCDQWDIVFVQKNNVETVITANNTPSLLAFLFPVEQPISAWCMRLMPSDIGHAQSNIKQLIQKISGTSTELLGAELTNNAKTKLATATNSSKRESRNTAESFNMTAKLLSWATRWLVHEIAESQMLNSPDRWLNQRIDLLTKQYNHTLGGVVITEFINRVAQQQQRENLERTQIKIKRGLATHLSWLATQIDRVAIEIDETIDSKIETHAEREKSTNY